MARVSRAELIALLKSAKLVCKIHVDRSRAADCGGAKVLLRKIEEALAAEKKNCERCLSRPRDCYCIGARGRAPF